MTLKIPYPPFHFIVTTEAEKNAQWHEGSTVYVTATDKYYILLSGSFVSLGGTGNFLKLDQTTPQDVDNDAPTFNAGIKIKAGQKLYFDS